MPGVSDRARFEREILPHLDAAYNLARWLLRGSDDAEDVAQEALLRAYKYFDGFHGENAKAWLLRIVRNSCYTWVKSRPKTETMSADEEGQLDPEHERALAEAGHGLPGPDARLLQEAHRPLGRGAGRGWQAGARWARVCARSSITTARLFPSIVRCGLSLAAPTRHPSRSP